MLSEDELDEMMLFKSSLAKLMMSLVAKPFAVISLCILLASILIALDASMFLTIIVLSIIAIACKICAKQNKE